MKIGDMVRVKTGSGYFEDGEETSCAWPDAADQIGVVVKLATRPHSYNSDNPHLNTVQHTVQIVVLGELAEFKHYAVEMV